MSFLQVFKGKPATYAKVNKPIYFMNRHAELLRIQNMKIMRISICIELDQTSSAITFLAIILRNKRMAEVCKCFQQQNKNLMTLWQVKLWGLWNCKTKSTVSRILKLLNFFAKTESYTNTL